MKKNLLMIIADDWSPIAGCYGDPVVQTPNIDALASRGVRFTNAYCTSPSCAASRGCLLTGLHSHAHGQFGHTQRPHNFRLLDGIPTLPALLREQGIRTGLLGKRHCAPDSAFPWEVTNPEISLRDPLALANDVEAFFQTLDERPFHLQVAQFLPHRTENAGFEDPRYEPLGKHRYDPGELHLPEFLPDAPAVREDYAEYCSAITRFDSAVGLIVAALERSGRAGETLIAVMSDHGMPFPGAKASPYESGHKCPLLIMDPGHAGQGSVNPSLVTWVDYLPTVLDWHGVEIPRGLHGRSFLPILHQTEMAEGWDEAFLSHTFHEVTNYYPYRILRRGRWKYVRSLIPGLTMPLPSDLFRSPTWQWVERRRPEMLGQRKTSDVLRRPTETLYDLESDPLETRNRAEDDDLQPLLAEMRARMESERARTGDIWLAASEQEHLICFP